MENCSGFEIHFGEDAEIGGRDAHPTRELQKLGEPDARLPFQLCVLVRRGRKFAIVKGASYFHHAFDHLQFVSEGLISIAQQIGDVLQFPALTLLSRDGLDRFHLFLRVLKVE
jgi:hypothetical protein